MRGQRRWLGLASGLLLAGSGVALADDPPLIAPAAGPIAVEGTFDFTGADPDEVKVLRRSASGIACARPGTCLVVFDEGSVARMATLQGDGVAAETPRVELADGGEVDAEGAAADGGFVYVTGSHGMKRKIVDGSCEKNRASRVVLRASVNPQTGRLDGAFEPGDLWSILKDQDALSGHLGKCLGTPQGVDIEAIAAADGRLHFGFRGPVEDGKAPILSVDAAGLFGQAEARPKLDRVKVGDGRGLRDMAAVPSGFLLLAGPDDLPADADAGWVLLFWPGEGADAVPLAHLDLSAVERRTGLDGCNDDKDRLDRKPEAIHPDPANHRVLVLSDGLCDGGPMWFDVPGAWAD